MDDFLKKKKKKKKKKNIKKKKKKKKKKTNMDDIDFSQEEVEIVELSGCVGNSFEFISNVLKYAHKLRKMVVSLCWREDETMLLNSDILLFQSVREKLQNVVGKGKLLFK